VKELRIYPWLSLRWGHLRLFRFTLDWRLNPRRWFLRNRPGRGWHRAVIDREVGLGPVLFTVYTERHWRYFTSEASDFLKHKG
jgi:hypothetical protein